MDPAPGRVRVDGDGVSDAQQPGRVGFPAVAEPPQRAQLAGVASVGEQPEGPASVDRGQLAVVTDEQDFRPGGGRLSGEGVEVEGAGHGRFVDDQQLPGAQPPPCVVVSKVGEGPVDPSLSCRLGSLDGARPLRVELGGECAAALLPGPGRLVHPLGDVLARDRQCVSQLLRCGGRGGRGRENGSAPVGGLPRGPHRAQCRRLARPRGSHEDVESPSGDRDRDHGVNLVRGQGHHRTVAGALRGGGDAPGRIGGRDGCRLVVVGVEEAPFGVEDADVGEGFLIGGGGTRWRRRPAGSGRGR